jgi:hypothetical protein
MGLLITGGAAAAVAGPASADECIRADAELCDWTVDPYQVLGSTKAEAILRKQGVPIQPRTFLQLRATMRARAVAEQRGGAR